MNLLPETWRDVDSHELRLLLKERIGGSGQYDLEISGDDPIHIPLAREECKLLLTYKKGYISEILAGPAFISSEWQAIVEEVEKTLRNGADVAARTIAFSSFRVLGVWASQNSSVRILPPPESAPKPQMEIAEHPFVLEYSYKSVVSESVTKYRANVAFQRITLLLNALLIGRTSSQPSSGTSMWTSRLVNEVPHYEWSHQGYFASLADYPPTSELLATQSELASIPDVAYYGVIGLDGNGLRVPESLDDSLAKFFALDSVSAAKMTRALYWFDVAGRVYSLSMSASFAALVSSIEALTERGNEQNVLCPNCGHVVTRETPGATKRFVDLVGRLAPGASDKRSRDRIYELRSRVLHGSALMQLDELKFVGWDPPEWKEQVHHHQLWRLTSQILRGWLSEAGESRPPDPHGWAAKPR